MLVDDFQFGRTSAVGDLRIPLPPASYSIRLEKSGFQTLSLPVNVLKDQESPVSVKLEREVIVAASFAVTGGVPGATVRLDGKEVGQVQSDGTFTHETSAGLHAIELVKTGYATLRTQQAFAIGKRVGIEGKMFSDPEAAEEADYQAIASSTDPAVLRQHLQQYPNSKNTTAILNKIEEIDWKTVNRTDLASLDAFLRNHAQGQHASEAQQLGCRIADGTSRLHRCREDRYERIVASFPRPSPEESLRRADTPETIPAGGQGCSSERASPLRRLL